MDKDVERIRKYLEKQDPDAVGKALSQIERAPDVLQFYALEELAAKQKRRDEAFGGDGRKLTQITLGARTWSMVFNVWPTQRMTADNVSYPQVMTDPKTGLLLLPGNHPEAYVVMPPETSEVVHYGQIEQVRPVFTSCDRSRASHSLVTCKNGSEIETTAAPCDIFGAVRMLASETVVTIDEEIPF